MSKLKIGILVDWSKSFVDKNGSFYCGTTEEQKDVARKVISFNDLLIYLSDVHSRTSSEFSVNGGLYPAHNLIKRDWYNLDKLDVKEGQTVSPELTEKLYQIVKDKPSGLIVPRHVFFQDYDGDKKMQPLFDLKDVEETFGVEKLNEERFMDGEIKYVVNAKHFFDGTRLQPTHYVGFFSGYPIDDYNIFTLLKEKYGQGKDLIINHTGVVTGICVYQTASGVRQIFPKAEVNIISDGTTHLLVEALGFGDKNYADNAIRSMCKQIGVNYLTSKEYLGTG